MPTRSHRMRTATSYQRTAPVIVLAQPVTCTHKTLHDALRPCLYMPRHARSHLVRRAAHRVYAHAPRYERSHIVLRATYRACAHAHRILHACSARAVDTQVLRLCCCLDVRAYVRLTKWRACISIHRTLATRCEALYLSITSSVKLTMQQILAPDVVTLALTTSKANVVPLQRNQSVS